MKSLYSIVLLLTAAASVRAAEGDRFASVAGSKKNGAFSVVHRTHLESLAKLVGELEATPEGSGSMMDNTLILYGSDNANWQHTDGNNWPFITIGNFGGTLKTGQFFDFSSAKTSINSFYNTLMHATGTSGTASTWAIAPRRPTTPAEDRSRN